MKRLVDLAAMTSALAIVLSGCALGVTRVEVAHSPLVSGAQKGQGTILVRQFVDDRKEDQRYIGTKRGGIFGAGSGYFGIKGEVRVDTLLTDYFAEALKTAGYEPVREQPVRADGSVTRVQVDAILEGNIEKFWLDMYAMTWHEVAVRVRLRDKDGQKVLWEKEIQGVEVNPLWFGMSSEFEKVIRQALDKALTRAVAEFASENFYQNVKK